jgi:alpha-methylacyl-CoA racemase
MIYADCMIDEDHAPRGALHGIRVVELAGIGPSALAAMMLADLGASVVRVERPSQPDATIYDLDASQQLALRGRARVVPLDLKSAGGSAAVSELIRDADVLIEGYRPGVLERLGLGPDDCRELNPRLVFGRLTGWGQTGPLAHLPGHDLNYLAMSGVLDLIGSPEGPPVIPLNLVADNAGGALTLVVGILAALHERSGSGLGQVVDAAMFDGIAQLAGPIVARWSIGAWSEARLDNLSDGGAPHYTTYRTKDDLWVAIAPLERPFLLRLCELMGFTEEDAVQLAADVLHKERWSEVREKFSAAFAQRTRAEWDAVLLTEETCYTPVLGLDEAVRHEHTRARGVYRDDSGVVQAEPAPRLSRTPSQAGTMRRAE